MKNLATANLFYTGEPQGKNHGCHHIYRCCRHSNSFVVAAIYPMSETYQALVEDDKVSWDGYYRVEATSCEEDFDSDVECGGGYYFAWSNPVFFLVD